MLFSSPIFLCLFFPLALLIDRLPGIRTRNAGLLLASLVFYAWGEPLIVGVMVASIAINFALARALEARDAAAPSPARGSRSLLLAGAVALNLSLLVWLKYGGFLAHNLGLALQGLGWELAPRAPVPLPIGVSFFTFQAVSYIVDVFRGAVRPARSVIDFGLYLSFFPQLIAGPIVRYSEVALDLGSRRVTAERFASGMRRFVRGLAKKVLIANGVAVAVDQIYALPLEGLSASVAWFGAVCYAFQIYFDFSGYSDMAIGMGAMLGLRLPENFAQPYLARSITDFWRRWHMTLSSWFRDYLYIPLGGSRRGRARTLVNLGLVFLLCGLWHGARWTFVVWGLYHGAFLIFERLLGEERLRRLPRPVSQAYSLLVVIFGWVFFRSLCLHDAGAYLQAMFGWSAPTSPAYGLDLYCHGRVLWSLLLGLLCCLPFPRGWPSAARPAQPESPNAVLHAASSILHLLLLALCLCFVVAGTQESFIYFRF